MLLLLRATSLQQRVVRSTESQISNLEISQKLGRVGRVGRVGLARPKKSSTPGNVHEIP